MEIMWGLREDYVGVRWLLCEQKGDRLQSVCLGSGLN